MKKVPALNLNDYLSTDVGVKDKFVKDLYNSFKEYGFVVLNNHPISPDLIKKVYKIQEDLFNLPLSVKTQHDLNNSGQRGYTKFGTENAKDTPNLKDLKEFWHIGRENVIANTWPQELPEFKPTFEELVEKLDKVGDLILEALGESLGCQPGYLSGIVKDGNSVLRLLHYPPVPPSIKDGQVRAAAHTDIDLLTLLLAAQGGGLELLTAEKEWLAIDSNPNSIAVNLGDMLSRMCNFQLPSTVHRVVNPDPTKNFSRYSIPYFIHPRNDVVLNLLPKFEKETPLEPIVTAGEFLDERLKEIGLKK